MANGLAVMMVPMYEDMPGAGENFIYMGGDLWGAARGICTLMPGMGFFGQCGQGDTSIRLVPTPLDLGGEPLRRHALRVASGNRHCVVVTTQPVRAEFLVGEAKERRAAKRRLLAKQRGETFEPKKTGVAAALAMFAAAGESARRRRRVAPSTLCCSTPGSMCPRLRIPAVSTIHTSWPSHSSNVSTLSRVVPGASCTREGVSPSNTLTSDDLPTFGRPTIASLVRRSVSIRYSTRGRRFWIASSRSPVAVPCIADTAIGSPRPRE